MISTIRARLRGLWNRRYFLLAQVRPPQIPVHSISWLPDGFRVQPIATTNVCVVDNFCNATEAEQLLLSPADLCEPLMHRAAMLAGLQANNLIEMSLLQVSNGSVQLESQIVTEEEVSGKGMEVLVVLANSCNNPHIMANTDKRLGIAVEIGRAICYPYTSQSSEQSPDWTSVESSRSLLRMRFSPAANSKLAKWSAEPRQTRTGIALTGNEKLPRGVWAPGQDYLESVFGKPDQLSKLIQ